jgi:hypothetical protein
MFQAAPKLRTRKAPKRKGLPVTVCVAAICDQNLIVGASDRMLTSADVQFEPSQTKLWFLSNSVAVMYAGDAFLQSDILQLVYEEIGKRIVANPTTWIKIRDVAELYSQYYCQARLKMAEKEILAPLGLTNQTFIDKQREMDSNLVRQLAEEILNFTAPDVEAIFTGIDAGGAHIYVVRNERVTCRDFAGFAAIGVGAWHANSQLMFGGHTKWKPFPETLFLVYNAKKRAEVAPGVGSVTDMFMIGPALGSYTFIDRNHINRLESIYYDRQAAEQTANIESIQRTTQYVEEITNTASAKEQTTPASVARAELPTEKIQVMDQPEVEVKNE